MEIIEECQELKNIKYKTMLLKGVPLHETKSTNDMTNLDKYLEAEKLNNSNEPWCKLNKTIKTKKLIESVEQYSKEKELTTNESFILIEFLKDSLDKKKLLRVKDVIYDKILGTIKEIPALSYNKTNAHFTLKNLDKRVSTLKSLAPKKINATIRHTHTPSYDSEIDDII
jgi:adenine C2-methylase RlmN of 23S rRNA A2503 and tRNA A37